MDLQQKIQLKDIIALPYTRFTDASGTIRNLNSILSFA